MDLFDKTKKKKKKKRNYEKEEEKKTNEVFECYYIRSISEITNRTRVRARGIYTTFTYTHLHSMYTRTHYDHVRDEHSKRK